MNKGNVIRSIFYGFITLILFTLGIVGLIYSIRITNTYKTDLEKVVKIFNSNSLIKEYRLHDNIISASFKGKKIKIISDAAITNEYTYTLKNGYLLSEYNETDTLGNNILMILTDSIAVNKGLNSGNVYPLFNKDEIFNYKLKEGIEIDKNNSMVKISLINPVYYFNNDINNSPITPDSENENSN